MRQLIKLFRYRIAKDMGGVDENDPTYKLVLSSAFNNPLKNLRQLSPDTMSKQMVKGIIHLANGRLIRAIGTFIKKER